MLPQPDSQVSNPIHLPVTSLPSATHLYSTALRTLGYAILPASLGTLPASTYIGLPSTSRIDLILVSSRLTAKQTHGGVKPPHIIFIAPSWQKVEEFHYAAVKAGGVSVLGPSMTKDVEGGKARVAAAVRDADGNWLEVRWEGVGEEGGRVKREDSHKEDRALVVFDGPGDTEHEDEANDEQIEVWRQDVARSSSEGSEGSDISKISELNRKDDTSYFKHHRTEPRQRRDGFSVHTHHHYHMPYLPHHSRPAHQETPPSSIPSESNSPHTTPPPDPLQRRPSQPSQSNHRRQSSQTSNPGTISNALIGATAALAFALAVKSSNSEASKEKGRRDTQTRPQRRRTTDDYDYKSHGRQGSGGSLKEVKEEHSSQPPKDGGPDRVRDREGLTRKGGRGFQ